MPRVARKKSLSGIYHIMLRGINRQLIFLDDEDNEKFLQTLIDCKKVSEFELYAYCIMGNHVHLLMKEGKEDLGQVFKRIGARYVFWYNWKYQRSGHLFQDRYRSEAVDNDPYFIVVLRYIHQNPKKAGLCKSISKYRWSSYGDYIRKSGIVDIDMALGIIGDSQFEKAMNEDIDDKCMEFADKSKRMTDEELVKDVEKKFNLKATMVQYESKEVMKGILREILKMEGVSTRQLSRVTGISANIIWRL